jgi:cytochrome c peroxidase
MKRLLVISVLCVFVLIAVSFTSNNAAEPGEGLRRIYSRPPGEWPKPFVDEGVDWKELGILPASPIEQYKDSLKHIIELGKALFFDPRLSGSGQISCASCHQPELSWTDGKEKSIGHGGTLNKRNSPTIQNVWFYSKLFWDGRARDLEDQAFAPVNSESEMHGDMRELPFKLRRVKGYAALFDSAYGDPRIDPDRIAKAIAIFEKSITSRQSRFDQFLSGKKNALTKEELKGLHLFRTRAKCMNCHNGPMFSDNQFHNNGFHLNGNPENDRGLYNVTHQQADIGKFKTPSLRDVAKTGPWMQNGMMRSLSELVDHYNKGADGNGGASSRIRMLYLAPSEKADLLAFLDAISADPLPFERPILPQ